MKKYLIEFICISFLGSSLVVAKEHSLKDLYQSALEQTSEVKDRIYSEQIAIERKGQVTAEVLPTLSVNSDHTWRDRVPTAGAFGEDYQHTSYASVSQPLFQGGSEYYALGVSKILPKIAALERIQSEINLYERISQAFYDVLRIQNEKKTLEDQRKTLNDRVKTLRSRAKIGQNKQTDVIAAQSQNAKITADLAQLESSLIQANQNLKRLTGLNKLGKLIDRQNVETLQVPAEWESNLEDSPQMKTLKLRLEAANKEISMTTGEFLPSVDLGANYYFDRAGIIQESKWDVGVNVSWELFSGGEDASERRIKLLEKKRIEAKLTDLKRNLISDFQSLKKDFMIKKDVLSKVRLAVNLAKKNYQEHMKEVDRGLVSQLDVLRVLEDYLQIRRSYEQQLFSAKLSWVRLKSLAGVRP